MTFSSHEKIAVFSCKGLGDGLITLILSHHLSKRHRVTTFHPFLQELQRWFPHLPLQPFPSCLEEFDRFFLFYERTPWMKKILSTCLLHYRSKTTILNPIATSHRDYPYWEEGRFDGALSFVENLTIFCRDILGIEDSHRENGISIPQGIVYRKYAKRITLHPTSSRRGKNWPRSKFLRLADTLKSQGWDPIFLVSPMERAEWPESPLFPNLDAVARFIFESAYIIGNDSGIGHLASCMGIPTLSIFRNKRSSTFWRPSFREGVVLLPKGRLPNLKWLRWRDKYWHWEISVCDVIRAFNQLCILGHETSLSSVLKKVNIIG